MLFFLKENHLIINRKFKWYAQLGTILKVTEAGQSEKYFLITCIWSTLRFLNPGGIHDSSWRNMGFKQEITAILSVILSDWSLKPTLQFVLDKLGSQDFWKFKVTQILSLYPLNVHTLGLCYVVEAGCLALKLHSGNNTCVAMRRLLTLSQP